MADHTFNTKTPVVVTFAGSDPFAAAGLQADLKTFAALGVYGASVVTAVTAQSASQFVLSEPVASNTVLAQWPAIKDELRLEAIKLGMLGSLENAAAVLSVIKTFEGAVVVDPVCKASSGGVLNTDLTIKNQWHSYYRDELMPYVSVFTPNIAEAAWLLDGDAAKNHQEMESQALALLALGPKAVLLKGGHSADERLATDYLAFYDQGEAKVQAFSAARLATPHGHGTGCTLASAIAAGIAQNLTIAQAVAQAKNYVQGGLLAADRLGLVASNGPLHHFSMLW